MNKIKVVCTFTMLLLLTGCAIVSVEKPATPFAQTATATPATNLDTPTPVNETPQPTCNNPAWSEIPTLSDISDLKWVTRRMPDGGSYQSLTGLPTSILEAESSPDGNWWVIEMPLPSTDELSGTITASALYVIDAGGNHHWIASANGRTHTFRRFGWLSDGRLVWVDGDRLQIADANGANRNKDLTTPEPVQDIRVGAGNLAFAIGKTTLWRVNLDTGAWDPVTGLPTVKRGLDEKELTFSLSPDKTYAAAVLAEKFWKIPLAFGAPPQMIADAYSDWGPGGPWNSWHGPQALGNTPFWLWYEKITNGASSVPFENVLIDTANAQIVPVDSLIPAGEYFSGRNDVSPDGSWLATSLFRKPLPDKPPEEPFEQIGFYVAPVSDLAKGILILEPLYVAGWRTDLPAAIVGRAFMKFDENQIIRQLSLTDGSFTELFSVPPKADYRVFVQSEKTLIGAGNTLYVFAEDGKKEKELSLSPDVANTLFAASNSQALISNVAANSISGQCVYQLLLVNIK